MLRYCLLASLLITGCAGSLSDPDRFQSGDDGAGDGGGADAAPDPTGGCPPGTDVPTDILAARCAGSVCHDNDAPAAGLDLGSADVASRLVDVASGCNDLLLIDSANPGGSYLIEKLQPTPTCGSRMPLGGALSDEELACVEEWVGSL